MTATPAATPTMMSTVCIRPSRKKRSATRNSKPGQSMVVAFA